MQPIRSLVALIWVAIWIVVAAVAINLIALALDGTPAMRWLPDRQTGVGYLIESKQRVDAAAAAYRSGAARDGKRLAAIVGISNVREGVSIETLDAALGNRWRFLGVAGAGAGTPSIAEQADLVLASDLRPDVVVLGISPLHLLDPLVDPVRSRAIAAGAPPAAGFDRIKAGVRNAVWLVNRRGDLRAWFDRLFMDARAAVQGVLGLDAATQDSRSPWRPMLRTLKEAAPTAKVIDTGVAWARLFSADDRAAYQQSRLGPKVGADMIRGFAARGACVVVVMMPEHSRLRALEPADIGPIVQSRLRTESGLPNLEVVDLRTAVPDGQFNDLVHLNTRGSEALSGRLALVIDGTTAGCGRPS